MEMNQTSYALWSDACREELLNFSKNQVGKDLVLKLLDCGLITKISMLINLLITLSPMMIFHWADRCDLAIWQDEDVVPPEIVSR